MAIRSVAWGLLVAAASVATAVPAHGEYKLVWSDEFDGPAIDPANWEHQVFPGVDSGNNELEYYTARPENSFIEDGCLVIQARKEAYKDHEYTSARLHTKGKRDFRYGKIEARIKLPSGQGLWPAFWMLPTESAYGTWAGSGEIDIVEATNVPRDVFGTIHFGGRWPNNVFKGARYAGPEGAPVGDFSRDFHVYTLEWQPYEMRWYVDGNLYSVLHEWHTEGAPYPAPFDKAFHIVLNLAVGGHMPGPPDASTPWPQEMRVDWVRAYQTDNRPPELDIVQPVKVVRVPAAEPIAVEAKVSDPDGDPVRVEVLNGDTVLATLTEAPFRFAWEAPDGFYTLRVRALDDEDFARTRVLEVMKGAGIPRRPFRDKAAAVPGVVEAENFDEGMPEDAYHDNDKVNHGNAYRKDQPVDVQPCEEGGFNLGWFEDGEWLTYTVDVREDAEYVPVFRVASPEGAGRFRLSVDGGSDTGTVSSPRTGGWQQFGEVEGKALGLPKGRQVLRLTVEKGGFNITSFTLRPVAGR